MAKETYLEVEGEPFRISSPEKVMFPEQGWTKLDLANHFVLTGEGALRGVLGRPTMLKRWPNGAGADPFYNKRAKPGDAMETVEIRFPSQRPGLMRVPRTVTDVLRMAQLNCLDLNPWNVRAEDIDHPDELRIDLDPTPDIPFADVRTVAAWCHEFLMQHGLVAWPKTSGSRGIHKRDTARVERNEHVPGRAPLCDVAVGVAGCQQNLRFHSFRCRGGEAGERFFNHASTSLSFLIPR